MHYFIKTLFTVVIGVAVLYLYRYMTGPHNVKKEDKVQTNYNGRYVKHNDIELWTETFGRPSDPAILLISGAMGSARGWTDQFCSSIAQKGFFVIRFDHRDTGLSTSIDYEQHPYTLDDWVEDLTAILDVYKISKAHLVGHSVGGMLAEIFAIKYPERCSSIAIISGKAVEVLEPTEQEKAILDRTWKIFLANKPTLNYQESVGGFLTSYRHLNGTIPFDETMARADIKDMYERSKHMYKTKDGQIKAFEVPHNHVRAQKEIKITQNDLKKIKIPTLIIHGQEDYIALPSNAKVTAESIPGSKLVMIPGMGHMFFNRKLEQQIAELIVDHARKKMKG